MRTAGKIFFLLCAFTCASLHAQQGMHLYDSLVKAVATMPDDSNKIKTMLAIVKSASAFSPDSQLVWANRGLTLSRKMNNKRGIAGFTSQIGVYYLDHGDQEKAVKLMIEALGYYEELKDMKNIARLNMNLGNTFYYKKDYTQAMRYHQLALDQYNSISNKKGVADCSMNLANEYIVTGDTTLALDLYNKSLKIREDIKDRIGIAQCLNNLGDTYGDLRDYNKAIDYFKRALAIKKDLGDNYSMAATYGAMAKLEQKRNNNNDAIKYGLESMRLCALSRNISVTQEAAFVLAEAYGSKKDFSNAYKYEVIGTNYKDSLFSAESNRSIAEMQTKYETDKKEKQNQILEQKNKIATLESGKKDAEISQQRIYIISAAIGLLLAFGLVLFIFKGYKDKQKAHYIISLQKKEVERQRDLVQEKQKEIVDSITYAKRIQGALLASDSLLKKNLPDHFVFYKPKDIVSGDFYWANLTPAGKFLLLTGDCTGHGVPGAFMSLLNITLLSEIVNEHRITQPDDILNEVRRDIILALNPEGSEEISQDGMDCSLCSFDFRNGNLALASAFNAVLLVRDGNVTEFPGDKQPVGFFEGDSRPFTLQKTEIKKGDTIYTFSDGFGDQFGGEKGKKYKYTNLKTFLLSIVHLPMNEQKKKLEEEFNSWKGDLFQVDDVLVIGIKIS
ncbi:MAG: tetratricopeptide repeat protein [Bacteroidetes bacterium]|nr:tetratricopeptide repeat protein [Bacteroidota bacterium]